MTDLIQQIRDPLIPDVEVLDTLRRIDHVTGAYIDQIMSELVQHRPHMGTRLLSVMEETRMEKYGVVTTPADKCPICGGELDDGNPRKCPVHGTQGIEKSSEDDNDGEDADQR